MREVEVELLVKRFIVSFEKPLVPNENMKVPGKRQAGSIVDVVDYFSSFATIDIGRLRSQGVGLAVGCWSDFVSRRTFSST